MKVVYNQESLKRIGYKSIKLIFSIFETLDLSACNTNRGRYVKRTKLKDIFLFIIWPLTKKFGF